uniref:Tissue factor pathway inhibitor n=1 Tax=Anser brachyrhynchus TaxID=132585 RepID=A0A8B9CPA2_9AVES
MLNVFRVLLSDICSASPAQQASNLILKLSCAVKQNNLVTVVLLLFITGAPLPPLKLGHSICPDFCFHEKDPGTCRGFFSRYFYNKETKLCEIFKYGGCLGNQNNFKSLEECQTTCQGNCNSVSCGICFPPPSPPKKNAGYKEPPAIPSLCMTPMDKGLCRAKETRFFYNYSTGRCRPFHYSGCGGNENNFTSRKSCLRICKKGMGNDTATDYHKRNKTHS